MEAIFNSIVGLSYDSVTLAARGLWLGVLIAAFVWGIRRVSKSMNAATAYCVWWTALVLVIVVPFAVGALPSLPELSQSFQAETETPVATMVALLPTHDTWTSPKHEHTPPQMSSMENTSPATQNPLPPAIQESPSRSQGSLGDNTPSTGAVILQLLTRFLPLACFASWICIMAVMSVRLIIAHRHMVMIKRHSIPIDRSEFLWLHRLVESVSPNRTVAIRQSTEVGCPVAAGLGRPIILLPVGLLDQMSNSGLESVVRHELAHIQRRDDWTNLAQRVVEALFFFNPGVWWIGRQLELEREVACDDLVVAHVGQPTEYARCLSRLAEWATAPGSALIPGALNGRKQIFQRFERLLSGHRHRTTSISSLRIAGTLVALCLTVGISVIAAPGIALPIEAVTYSEFSRSLRIIAGDVLSSSKDDAQGPVTATVGGVSASINGTPVGPTSMSHSTLSDDPEASMSMTVHLADRVGQVSSSRSFNLNTAAEAQGATEPVESSPPSGELVGMSYPTREAREVDAAGPTYAVAEESGDNDAEVTGVGSYSSIEDDGERTMSWSDGWDRIKVRMRGDITFNDDDKEIESISRDGYLAFRIRKGRHDFELFVEPGRDGLLEYYDNFNGRGDALVVPPEWLADALLDIIRMTGLGAEKRASRIYHDDGVNGVLNELEEIPSDYVTRLYLTVVLQEGDLSQNDYSQMMKFVAQRIDSDYEKAELLIDLSDEVRKNGDLIGEYVDVVETIDSDYETRRVLTAVGIGDAVDPDVVEAVVNIADRMDSDFEKAELLIQLADQIRDNALLIDDYVRIVGTIDSDYETRRVLSAVGIGQNTDPEITAAVLDIARNISSDFEMAELLIEMAPQCRTNGGFQKSYVDAVVEIDSDYEARRVLSALGLGDDTDPEVLAVVLKIAGRLGSDFEKAELLIDLAPSICKMNQQRDLYLTTAAEISSDYETKRTLLAIIHECDLNDQDVLAVLSAAKRMSSDFEKGEVLKDLVEYCKGNEALEDAFLDAVDSMSSDYEAKELYSLMYRRGRR